jgi:hypothetical protein
MLGSIIIYTENYGSRPSKGRLPSIQFYLLSKGFYKFKNTQFDSKEHPEGLNFRDVEGQTLHQNTFKSQSLHLH